VVSSKTYQKYSSKRLDFFEFKPKQVHPRQHQISQCDSACFAQANSGLRHVWNVIHMNLSCNFYISVGCGQNVEFAHRPTDLR